MFPPLTEANPAFHAECWLCQQPLGNGQKVQVLVLGPEDAEQRAKHHAGRWYSASAILLHAACVQGVEPDAPLPVL